MFAYFGLRRYTSWFFARCMHPASRRDLSPDRKLDILVTGLTHRKFVEHLPCRTCRDVGECGETGKLWEPRR
jgi:hypothetical protein